MIGRALSHYQIEEKLGEGGMGVVYRARDTHLDRPVAVKVLRAEAVADPERKRRFVQEARSASALNHPNIITIYDIDQADGVDFIAMEWVDGRALDRLIGTRDLPLGEALGCAAQVADALAAAHAAGIIHRDVKPANIMVTAQGLTKVLDFGLAKLAESGEAPEQAATVDLAARTVEGMILGTVAYMSPEQAEGRKVDARSDIFAFGSLLYEMLSGRRAFQGETRLSTLSAILSKEPAPLRDLAVGVPAELERILALCLKKDPRRRFQHMDDVKVALEAVREQPLVEALAPAPVPLTRRGPGRLKLAAAAVVLIATTAGVTWWFSRVGSEPPLERPLVLTRLTSDPGLATDPALSPDGKLVAYASDRSGEGNLDLWVQPVAGGQAIRLTRHPGDDREPAFSPDGARIAFRSEQEGGGVYVTSVFGGEARRVADQGRRPRFSPDGSLIAYWTGFAGVGDASAPGAGKIFVVPATGGAPRQLAPEFPAATQPVWSPDGRHILFFGTHNPSRPGFAGDYDWWVAPLAAGPPVRTGAYAAFQRLGLIGLFVVPGEWAAAGNRVIFSAVLGDSSSLWQISLTPGAWQARDIVRLTSGAGMEAQPSLAGGAMAFASIAENLDIWSLPLEANRGRITGDPRQLTSDAAAESAPGLSADGRKLVFQSNRSGNDDIWMKDLATGKETGLTVAPTSETGPRITDDGSQVAYFIDSDRAIYALAVGRPGSARKICEDCGFLWGWSRDATKILYFVTGPPRRLGIADVSSGVKTEILRHPEWGLYRPEFSPDDRWIAFEARIRPGSSRLVVAPYRGSPSPVSEWVLVTPGDSWDSLPRWSPDGNLLYFTSERDQFRCIWAQRLEPATKRPEGAPFVVRHFHDPRRSLLNVRFNELDLAAAIDKLAFVMAERTGNIWLARRSP